LLDSGATGPVLSSKWIKSTQAPCVRRRIQTPIHDASGNRIPGSGLHYTKSLDLKIGDHMNGMRFEVADMADTRVDGYLPMSWLKDHNPDIDWKVGSLTWRSDFCKANCLTKQRRLVYMMDEELLAEDPENVYFLGTVQFSDDKGEDVTVQLLPEYKDFGDIFSQENIDALPEHTKYDHRIDLIPGSTPPFGPIYPLAEKERKAL
ncbi:unnamed protein product, partial [Tuber aestivum]